MENFQNKTLSTSLFKVEDVTPDNGCFYRSIANSLNSQSNNPFDLKELKFVKKKENEFYNHTDFGLKGTKQTELAKKLQEESRLWLIKNKNNIYKELGITYKDLIENVHNLDIDEYEKFYKFWSGDAVFQYVAFGIYKSGKNKGQPKLKKVYFPDRWGGIPEIIALSNILELPIIVFRPVKLNKHNIEVSGRIIKNKPEKKCRFKLYQISGKKFFNKNAIFLLWRKRSSKGDHYNVIYPNVPIKNIINII